MSITARFIVFVGTGIISIPILLAIIDRQFASASVLWSLALSAQGVSNAWFFAGLGQPRKILVFDALPRMLGLIGSIAILSISGSAVAFAGILLLSELLIVAVVAHRYATFRKDCLREALASVKDQLPIALSSVAGSLATRSSPLLVALTDPGAVGQFALAMRILQAARTTLKPVINMLQGWVVRYAASQSKRARTSLIILIGYSAIVAASLVITFGLGLGEKVLGPEISLQEIQVFLIAATVVMVAASSALAIGFLIPDGRQNHAAAAITLGSIISILATIGGSLSLAATGAMLGVLLGQASVLVVSTGFVIRASR
ncbi:hypothetical protein [Nocardioides bruguierae]|uniref:hypothetical protein n=1 Tax=Nocardioides bruguierae TaxID=2945102 RepID=UPI002020DB38|nr:hypothetical protein [Nocardioides bruguierae]MCL8026272.1 hypothetical protein [Nocardioides bruguierae]